MAENNRYIVQVFVGALSQHYEALSVEASKQTSSEEIVCCIVDRLSLTNPSNYELAEVIGDSVGQECKERRVGAVECPVALMLLWPKMCSGPGEDGDQQEYRFYLREKLSDTLWTDSHKSNSSIAASNQKNFQPLSARVLGPAKSCHPGWLLPYVNTNVCSKKDLDLMVTLQTLTVPSYPLKDAKETQISVKEKLIDDQAVAAGGGRLLARCESPPNVTDVGDATDPDFVLPLTDNAPNAAGVPDCPSNSTLPVATKLIKWTTLRISDSPMARRPSAILQDDPLLYFHITQLPTFGHTLDVMKSCDQQCMMLACNRFHRLAGDQYPDVEKQARLLGPRPRLKNVASGTILASISEDLRAKLQINETDDHFLTKLSIHTSALHKRATVEDIDVAPAFDLSISSSSASDPSDTIQGCSIIQVANWLIEQQLVAVEEMVNGPFSKVGLTEGMDVPIFFVMDCEVKGLQSNSEVLPQRGAKKLEELWRTSALRCETTAAICRKANRKQPASWSSNLRSAARDFDESSPLDFCCLSSLAITQRFASSSIRLDTKSFVRDSMMNLMKQSQNLEPHSSKIGGFSVDFFDNINSICPSVDLSQNQSFQLLSDSCSSLCHQIENGVGKDSSPDLIEILLPKPLSSAQILFERLPTDQDDYDSCNKLTNVFGACFQAMRKKSAVEPVVAEQRTQTLSIHSEQVLTEKTEGLSHDGQAQK
ncbi:hypothetical protein J437_LFUL002043 [Ladona fulva]|uniref:Ras-associating domain-containing protein n=1 Tax=Ladona fulva TaxID=123851 RepID=A0A8K0JWE2_LADFU|nr:hypothetical protein J437_LFUL002043 [Ladona fulva]